MRHTTVTTPALEEAYPFEDGENNEAAIARHGGVGAVGMRRATLELRPRLDRPEGHVPGLLTPVGPRRSASVIP